MKMAKICFLLSILFAAQAARGQLHPLFPIWQNDRLGYINNHGGIVLRPIYRAGHAFSEGLAAVRENGLYGFINDQGVYVIPPQYDFATSFNNGIALVYVGDQPRFIDRNGNTALPTAYKALSFVDERHALVTTTGGRKGVIDIVTKKLLIDTVFADVNSFVEGIAIVKEYDPTNQKAHDRAALIDTNGRFIAPFGKYEAIKPFVDGFANVEIEDPKNKDGNMDGLIDREGRLLFERPYRNNSYIKGAFHDGYAAVELYKYWLPEKPGVLSTSEKGYEGFINQKGELALNDTTYRYVYDFADGRAFVRKNERKYLLLDRNFRQVGNELYSDVVNKRFQNGYAIVEGRDGFGIIDTTGRYLVPPTYEGIHEAGIVNGFFFFSETDKHDQTLYGIADLQGHVLLKPVMSAFDRNGFVNDLLRAEINGKLVYINKHGTIVWRQRPEASTALKPLNIDFMNRGYFYAYSSPKKSGDASEGWSVSSNRPQKPASGRFPANRLAVTIDTTRAATFQDKYLGFQLFISNTTKDTVGFNAQDSRLYLQLQALDEKGVWRDIEYLPNSWCGNSYHQVELEPDAFWSFVIPKYDGAIHTKIRAALTYIEGKDPRAQQVIYSNAIDGGINPGHFWNKRTYFPSGIMDPYND